MKISKLATDIITAVYQHQEEELTLDIDRNAITPEFLRQISKTLEEPEVQNGHKRTQAEDFNEAARLMERNAKMCQSLVHLVKAWDLTEDDGSTPVPLSAESLNRLPALLIQNLWSFVMAEAQSVKKTTSENSENGTAVVEGVGQSMSRNT